jgi:type II secretory pathway pseudopilin PulG
MVRRWRTTPDERGETLLELLIAVVIMGITVVAVIGGLATSIKISDIHRKQATAGAAVRSWAEAIENYVASTSYIDCAGRDAYKPSVVGYLPSLPVGYTWSQTAATSWDGSSSNWVSCVSDNGYQKVLLSVTSPDLRVTETLDIVLRKPCRPTDASCS